MFSRKNHHSQRRGSILKSARGNKTTSAGAGSAEKEHWTDLRKLSKYYYKYINRDVVRQKSDPYLHHIGKPPENKHHYQMLVNLINLREWSESQKQILVHQATRIQRWSERGGGRNLANQLTLFKPGGQIMPLTLLSAPPPDS